jgi:hypothetical protein
MFLFIEEQVFNMEQYGNKGKCEGLWLECCPDGARRVWHDADGEANHCAKPWLMVEAKENRPAHVALRGCWHA